MMEKRKVLVIGSGPIIIGQAAEFDYAGTQACQSLREEGYEVVLVNSNPATIMTDRDIADRVYIEPISLEFVTEIIRKERPYGVLATLGGQVGLNMAVELSEAGVLKEYNVKLLGTTLEAIKQAEDRELFKEAMKRINQPVPESDIFSDVAEAVEFANRIGYPIIIRPAYTLGGTGGGIAHNEEEMYMIALRGIKLSPIHQILVERSVAGWKEVEYEVMRDRADNCIIVCNMENIDPVGVHTGDSVVVAPSQTLNDIQYQMLRTASVDIIRYLEIEGGCNVQYALDPYSNQYYVIEVNPRVSRSSALASKATGYPIAKVAAKVAIGMTLDEITNAVTGETKACFEPSLDYVVTKFPRWPFEKFNLADRTLGTQMKATGEVMAIDRTLEGSLLKAIRSLEIGLDHIELKKIVHETPEQLIERLQLVDDERLYVIAQALRVGISVEKICYITKINSFFINKIKNIVLVEKDLATNGVTEANLKTAKRYSFPDQVIARYANCSAEEVSAKRNEWNIHPTYKYVDTCAAEFEAHTPYYYSAYAKEDEVVPRGENSVIVLGSGPIRIGQGVEFDYCSVHSSWALRKAGMKSIIINNNPETVSTDFDTSDSLYFEPLTVDDVMEIIRKENPVGVIAQFGGQTAINLAAKLEKHGVKILGTALEEIDNAEDRDKFEELLHKLDIPQPLGKTAFDVETAVKNAEEIGYPVLVRPSYVLGGRAMEIVYEEAELRRYMKTAVKLTPEHPVLTDRYLVGREIEVDAISDGETVIIPGIMEHIERAGVHSGDSIAVYPPQTLTEDEKAKLIEYTIKLAKGLNIVGLLNIQYVISKGEVFVLEVNPRSSRTVPFLSKITGVPMAKLAAGAIIGETLKSKGYETGLLPEAQNVYTKVPVFSFQKLKDVDTTLGPEMKSTGEVMGSDRTLEKSLYKGLLAAGIKVSDQGNILFTISDDDKEEALNIAKRFFDLGYNLLATEGTAKYLDEHGLRVTPVGKINQSDYSVLDAIYNGDVDVVVNTTSKDKDVTKDGFKIRRVASEQEVVCLTSLDTADALLKVLESISFDILPL